jgi:hypothetical protein
MQEPENPVAARGTAPDPILSYYYHYYYDKHYTPWLGVTPRGLAAQSIIICFTSEGVTQP